MTPQPEWWPQWEGETLVIVASGPSAGLVPIDEAQGKAKVIVINTSFRLAPWADMLFACDYNWWNNTPDWRDFKGQKLSIERRACDKWGLGYVHCMKPDNRVLLDPKGTVGWGGNSGFHCLNLAIQFGVKRVLLVGYDMHLESGFHWHGAHGNGMSNPKHCHMPIWRKSVDGAATVARAHGVDVINCSPTSTLKNYRKMDFMEALEC